MAITEERVCPLSDLIKKKNVRGLIHDDADLRGCSCGRTIAGVSMGEGGDAAWHGLFGF